MIDRIWSIVFYVTLLTAVILYWREDNTAAALFAAYFTFASAVVAVQRRLRKDLKISDTLCRQALDLCGRATRAAKQPFTHSNS